MRSSELIYHLIGLWAIVSFSFVSNPQAQSTKAETSSGFINSDRI